MSEAEDIWRRKADDEVLAAALRLGEYTEEAERVIRAELRRRGLDEPPKTVRDPPQTSILHRYIDAYRVASAVIAFGTTIKVIGVVVSGIFVLAGFSSSSSLGSSGLIGGFLVAALCVAMFWIAGVLVTAQGQVLRASLDTAVNSSPFLSDTQKANMIGITPPSATK